MQTNNRLQAYQSVQKLTYVQNKQVNKCKYLRPQVNSTNNNTFEIRRRLYLVNRTYYELVKYLKTDVISLNMQSGNHLLCHC